MKLRNACIGLLVTGCAIAATACGSSSPSGTNSPSAKDAAVDTSGIATAKASVAAALTEPTKIPETIPLPRAPKKGIKVIFLTCSAAACSLLNPGFIAAAKALGWDPTVITYNSATPGAAVQQAINEGYKYIATTSITLSTITPQVQEAKAKGIAIFGAYTADTPQGASNGLYGVAEDGASDYKSGELEADWMIANSGGRADAVYVDIPLYPSLVLQGQGTAAEFAKLCPSCKYATLPVSVTQLASGQVPAAIVTYLQAHPSVNYLYISFQDLDTGVYAALRTADLTGRVKIVGTEAQAAELHEIVSGQETMWTIAPEPYVMWAVVDWMARLSEGVLTPAALAASDEGPEFIVDTPAAATAMLGVDDGNWPGPTNYQAQYEKLWHVGS
jgi:ABC-type sugar transport system substrate-binding protein